MNHKTVNNRVVVLVLRLLVFLVSLLVSGAVLAEQDITYKSHTVINFDADSISGDLSKPDAQYLKSRKRLRHQRLIKLRKSFRLQILQSIKDF